MFNAEKRTRSEIKKNTDNVSQDWVSVSTSFIWHTYTYKMHGTKKTILGRIEKVS